MLSITTENTSILERNVKKAVLRILLQNQITQQHQSDKPQGSYLAWYNWDSSQVQFLCITGECCGVPVHLILLTAALPQHARAVDQRRRQPATVWHAPAACHPPLHYRRVPTPVIRGETLEDNADVHTCGRYRQQTKNGEDALLTATELPSFFQDVIKSSHGCRRDVLWCAFSVCLSSLLSESDNWWADPLGF